MNSQTSAQHTGRLHQYEQDFNFTFQGQVKAMAFCPDGQFFTAGISRLLHIWRLDSLEAPYVDYYAHEEASVTSLLWKHGGLYCSYDSGEIVVLSITDNTEGKVRTTL